MSKDYVKIDGKEIRVYQVCSEESVAAETDEDALEWYKNEFGFDDDELYDLEFVEKVNLDEVVLEGEGTEKTITVREIVEEYWKGEPFVALTTLY